MGHFTLPSGSPVLPAYLLEADIAASIIPPQDYTAVPTSDGRVFLNWLKDSATTDDGFLFSELYRSTNLTDWYLIATLDYPTASYHDADVKVGLNYYYKVRFVRIDGEGFIINQSSYTVPLAATPVNALTFEPRDTYANKFFKYLIDALPGHYVYDHTDAAWFLSNKEHLWQTACRILDGFVIKADGVVVDTHPADPTALYAKRNVGFFLTKKHMKLLGVDSQTGSEGELIQVSQYLIYTFLMGYAAQFLRLYDWYKEIVASKYIDCSQLYTKGFRPIMSAEASPTIAEIYDTFGKMLNLEPLRAFTTYQGLVSYKNMLMSSFTNIDSVGMVSAVNDACSNVLGITTQTLFEYWKYPWFRASRDFKLFAAPTASDEVFGYAIHSGIPIPPSTPWTPAGANVSMKYTSLQSHFNVFVEYVQDNAVSVGNEWFEVHGSSPENPFTYIITAHISIGNTVASTIPTKISADPSCSWLVTATPSNGVASGTLLANDRFRLTRHTSWLAWEAAMLKMYGHSFLLKDASASLTVNTVRSTFGCIIAKSNPNSNLLPGATGMTGSQNYIWDGSTWQTDSGSSLFVGSSIVMRDDNDEGAMFEYTNGGYNYAAKHTGHKKSLFKMGLTPSGMSWLQEGKLTLNVQVNTKAGYLRLYRLKKNYNQSWVSWNFREKQVINGYNWNGQSYDTISREWVTKYWDEVGVEGSDDAVLLKEVYIPEIAYVSGGTPFNIDLTDVLQHIYKYEASNLNMGADPESILECGFMLSAEAMPNKAITVFDLIPNSQPVIQTKKMGQGFFSAQNGTKYFYIDGTTRYGRLLVMQSDREPQNYIRTVYERIRKEDILMASGIVLTVNTVPVDFVENAVLYGVTSKAVGAITGVGADYFTVSEGVKHFIAGETIRLLDDSTMVSGSAVISSVDRNGLKKVRLARTPINGSIMQVYYTGSDVLASISYPTTYPSYTTYVEGMDGLWPVFISTLPASAQRLYFADRDSEDLDVVNLNTTMALDTLGDVVVMYQYEYDFLPMGRVLADDTFINDIQGCQRTDSHLFSQSDKDMKYHENLMLPKPSDGALVDMSGEMTANEYSDYNMGVLAEAVKNIRRFDGPIDVFKYAPTIKDYIFGQQYHTFLKGT